MSHVLQLDIPTHDHNTLIGFNHLVEFEPLRQAIQESKNILDLEDDWDGEGSSAYSEAVWKKATDFLKQNAVLVWKNCKRVIPAPTISPGPNGSIDLDWQTETHELLVNILPDSDILGRYYGESKIGGVIKGPLNLSTTNQWLMMWLTE